MHPRIVCVNVHSRFAASEPVTSNDDGRSLPTGFRQPIYSLSPLPVSDQSEPLGAIVVTSEQPLSRNTGR